MTEWQAFFAVIASLVSVLGLMHVGIKDVLAHIDKQFADAERRHQEASTLFRQELQLRYVGRGEFSEEIHRLRTAISELTVLVEGMASQLPPVI
jgi:hypothetical protein